MKNKTNPRLGIYFSHFECFGHTAIVMALGEVFKKRFPKGSLFFIQAGTPQPNAQLSKLGKVYRLPGVISDRGNFREVVHRENVDTDERSKKIGDILSREKPDLLITEYFPLGHEENRFELIAPLIKARSLGATIWGVAGHPLVTGDAQGWREKILKPYQRIIILSPQIEKDKIASTYALPQMKQNYLKFFERHAKKISFSGYLLPQQDVVRDDSIARKSHRPIPKNTCRVTVVRGGGAYYPKLIADAILAGDKLGKTYHLTVIAGPSTTPNEWKLFSGLVRQKKIDNVLLLKSVGNYEERIATCDVCVSVASYNTAVMLLKHRKKAVVIPFEGYDGPMNFPEQPARAKMLNQYLGAQVISIKDLTASRLAEAIKAANRSKKIRKVPEGWFSADETLKQAFAELFSR